MKAWRAIVWATTVAGCGWQSQALANVKASARGGVDTSGRVSDAGASLVQQARVEKARSVLLKVPEGWRRIDEENRILFVPPLTSADRAVLSVEDGVEVAGRFGRWFDKAWSEFVGGHSGLETTGSVTTGRSPNGYEWRWQLASMEDGAGGHLYVFFSAARQRTRVQPLVFLSIDAETFNSYTDQVAVLLQTGLSFLAADELPPTSTGARIAAADLLKATGSSSPSSRDERLAVTPSDRVWGRPGGSPLGPSVPGALNGIYEGLARGLSAAATSVDFGVSRRQVTFYPDGRVFRRVPEGGLEGFDREASEAAVPALWGRYREVRAGRWEIHWNESDRVSLVERQGEGLRFEGEMVFPVASCEGLRLVGTFSLQSAGPDFPFSITFDREGNFRDDDLIGTLAYEDIVMPNPRTIVGGVGTYRIGRNTLYLTYNDGRLVLVAIHASTEAVRASPVSAMSLNGWPLVRRS